MTTENLTQSRLHSLLDYDPETGIFTWKKREPSVSDNPAKISSWNSKYAEAPAGVRTHGYFRISIDDKKYYSHRLAFLFVLGRWPYDLVDHINGNGFDNRWENLRDSTKKANSENSNNRARKNKTGFTGVVKLGEGRFMAQCGALRRLKGSSYLGVFKSAEEAHQEYLKAKALLKG